jgi:hypothetical protein
MAYSGERVENGESDEQAKLAAIERGKPFMDKLILLLRSFEISAKCGDMVTREQVEFDHPAIGLHSARASRLRIKISWPESENVFLLLGKDVNYEVHLHTPPKPTGDIIDVKTRSAGDKLEDFYSPEIWLRLGYQKDEDWATLVVKGKEEPIKGTRQSTVDVYRLHPGAHKLGLTSPDPSIIVGK